MSLLTHGSLFSGIGGFDLAAEWMGWENKFHCEWNEFGQKVLKYYWPQAELFTDITKSDFRKYANTIDVLTGGFPCQPYSLAGKRKGKEDERHLWPEMLRAIREIQPRWVVGENVFGLVNWNGGMVFDEVQSDLEAEGYEVFPYVLPACAKNAPHRRDRIWFVAYACGNGGQANTERKGFTHKENREQPECLYSGEFNVESGIVANSSNSGIESLRSKRQNPIHGFETSPNTARSSQQGQLQQRQGQREFGGCNSENATDSSSSRRIQNNQEFEAGQLKQNISSWRHFPTQSPICNGDDGFSGRLDSITFPKWRSESIKAGGNAVVPQIPFEIFKAIEKYENGN